MDGKERKPMIYASEIGQYHFCPIAWYLQRCGYKSSSSYIHQGEKKHNKYGEMLHKRNTTQILSKKIILGGILGIILSFVLFLLEVVL
jgi:hypothetical protein